MRFPEVSNVFSARGEKNGKLQGGLFNSVTVALKGLDPSESKISQTLFSRVSTFPLGLQQEAQL